MNKEETQTPSMFMREHRKLTRYPYAAIIAAIIGLKQLSMLPERVVKVVGKLLKHLK